MAWDTVQSVRVLSARCPWHCVCPFFMDGALREVSPHWPLPKGETSVRHLAHTLDTHKSNLCSRRTRIPSPCSLLTCLGTRVASNRFDAVRRFQTNPQVEPQQPGKARIPEQDPNPNHQSHQGYKGDANTEKKHLGSNERPLLPPCSSAGRALRHRTVRSRPGDLNASRRPPAGQEKM